jgi:hypothetical protein
LFIVHEIIYQIRKSEEAHESAHESEF